MIEAKTAVFAGANQPFELLNVSIPTLESGQIMVKNEYVTLCKSDINTFCGKRTEKTPTILGHEIVGRILGFGSDAPQIDMRGDEINIGDRITWAIYAANPDSEMSKKGIPQKSTDLFKYGHEAITADSHLHGGLSECILLRANTPVVKISETVPVQLAALVNCSVATIAGALRQAGEIKNKKVLISGTGMLGIIACAMCKTMGASAIFALDIDRKRIETAQLFGATDGALISEDVPAVLSEKYGSTSPFDIIIELSGLPDSMENTLVWLGIGGVAVWVGATYPARNTQINAETIIRKLHTIRGLHNYNNDDFVSAVNFIEHYHDHFPFGTLIHDHFSLSDVNDAFQYAINHNPFRVGLKL